MSLYKRGKFWWYSFSFNGRRVQRSTKQCNRQAAEDIQAAVRTALAKGEVGILEHAPIPTLRDFSQRFLDNAAVGRPQAPKESTLEFYAARLNRILAFEPLATATLDAITPELLQRYVKSRQSSVSPACINRELATLRRCLHVALDLGLIQTVPKMALLQGERGREFVLSPILEAAYLERAPRPLRDAAILMLETGLSVSEVCGLDWADVYLEPVGHAQFGFIHIRRGKTKHRNRTVPLTARAGAVLKGRRVEARSVHVFNAEKNGDRLSRSTLSHKHTAHRRYLRMPPEFVVHSFRHTFLTRLGASGADAFTIKRIAGHSSVTVSEKYIHPTPESLELTFRKFEDIQRPKLT